MKDIFCASLLFFLLVLTACAQKNVSRSPFFAKFSSPDFLDELIQGSGEKEIDGIEGTWNTEQAKINGCFVNLYTQDSAINKIEYSDGDELIPRITKSLQKMFDKLKIRTKPKSNWREYSNLSYQSSNFTGFITMRGTFRKNSSNEDEFVLYFVVSETFCNSTKK